MKLRLPQSRRRRRNAGFTLLELLVAASVLAIILFLFSRLADLASQSWRGGLRRADNHAQARVILGLIERDIQSMIFRPDVAAFVDENQQPACAFYTSFAAPGGNRKLSLVSYDLESGNPPKLVRRDLSFDFGTDEGPLFGDLNKLDALRNANRQVLTENVLKFEVQFLDGGGNVSNTFSYDHDAPQAPGNTRAVLVSLLALDTSAMDLARKNGDLGRINTKVGGSPSANQTYSDLWNGIVATSAFSEDLSLPVRSGVRVFKREFNLPFAAVQ